MLNTFATFHPYDSLFCIIVAILELAQMHMHKCICPELVIPKTSPALDYLPKVDCTLVNYPIRT
jgi:energy-converting hydrogenase Eha subunit F